MMYYIVSVLFLMSVWCPCMAINVSVQYNGGLLPDIILLTQYYYHRGTRLKCHKEVLYLQPMIPPKRFDIFPPGWGTLRRSRRVQIFFINLTDTTKTDNTHNVYTIKYIQCSGATRRLLLQSFVCFSETAIR